MRMLASKIHGSLAGALLGDCLGAPFEGDVGPVSTFLYRKYFEGLKADDSTKKREY
jgi:poly(ADP-ribose) glycohydrolase ARH3